MRAPSSRTAMYSGTSANITRAQRGSRPCSEGLRRVRRKEESVDTSQKGMVPSSSQRPGRHTIQHCSPEVVRADGTEKMSPTCNGSASGAASAGRGGTTDREREDRI